MRNLGVLVFSLALLLPVHAGAPDPSCPKPTVAQGGECVLAGDAVLHSTLRLASFTKLNCKGHRLTPADAGVLDDPRTADNEFEPSQPEVAILLRHAYGAKIQNCVIDGFDFGILLLETKTPPGGRATGGTSNKILANTIDVRTNAVRLIRSDNARIADNRITYASERGRGLVIEFDSDDNEIVGNTITSTDAASTGRVRQLPGGVFADDQTAIMDNEIHLLQNNRSLHNIVIGAELIQIANDRSATELEDSSRPDHNLIEGNTIVDVGVGASCTRDPAIICRANGDCPSGKGPCLLKQNSGIGFNIRAADTIVRGNSISGTMERGVSFGGVGATFTVPNWYPGRCSLLPSRLCIDDADCNHPGYDRVSNGTCGGASPVSFNGNSLRLTAEGNSVTGSFSSAALFANNTDAFSMVHNVIEGAGAMVSGITVQGTALNGTVQHNVVHAANNALFLGRPAAFTATISLNDFTRYTTAIRTTNDYSLTTSLGGNYWGLPCPGFDPAKVRFENGAVNPNVTDAHPYGVPVARSGGTVPPCFAP